MNVKSLYSVVEKIIVPKYPWINGYVWTSYHSGGFTYYSLEVTVDQDFYLYRTDTTDLHRKLYYEVKSLFKMLGPDMSDSFDDVVILPENE